MAKEFHTGDLVWVDKKKVPSHFTGDCYALVLEKSNHLDDYSLMLHGTDFHAWYPAECLELIQEGNFQLLQQKEKELKAANEKPYISHVVVSTEQRYNPEYGDERICTCGHVYRRHFDTYDNMAAIGCKYCQCRTFVEA
jgi:hypothetical protein